MDLISGKKYLVHIQQPKHGPWRPKRKDNYDFYTIRTYYRARIDKCGTYPAGFYRRGQSFYPTECITEWMELPMFDQFEVFGITSPYHIIRGFEYKYLVWRQDGCYIDDGHVAIRSGHKLRNKDIRYMLPIYENGNGWNKYADS